MIEIDKPEFSEFYDCTCHAHVLRIQKFLNEEQVYIDKYNMAISNEPSLYQRIKLSLGFIFKPSKYQINGDIILSRQDARRLGEDLLKITVKKPDNLITGDK